MTDSLSDSLSNPKKFWKEAAEEISWNKKPELAFNPNNPNLPYPQYEWFPNSTLNMCYNCIDRHVVAGHGSQIALYYDSPVSITKIQYSYSEMQQKVSDLAKLFLDYKIKKGDIVLIYMPMIPEAVFSMLACARVGAIHTVVFGGFGPNELAKRIQDSNPVLILTASCGIEVKKIIPYHPLLAQALKLSKRPKHILVYQRPMLKAQIDEALGERDWNLELERTFTSELTPCVPVDGSHSLYLLYTSGSTGAPKGILRETGPHAVSLLWSMKNTFGLKPGMCMFTNSDIGWVLLI